jgi:penicillin-binding protein 1A
MRLRAGVDAVKGRLRAGAAAFGRSPRAQRAVLLGALAGVGLGSGVAWGSWTRACAGGNCPSIGALDAYRPTQALKIYAADGRLITSLGAERRTVVRLDELPPALPAAFVAVEDKRFFSHGGVDYRRFFGALARNVVERRFAEGFSTLTMQLARNVWDEKLPSTKSLVRKVREIRVALELERTYPKERILELYLNQIFLGGSLYGVEAAAQNYFGKPAAQINVAEAALIAGITKFPNFYDPRRHPDRALQRRNVVLNLMRDQGYLAGADADRWKAYPLVLSARQDFAEAAPYFVEWVRQQVYARFGAATFERGYRVYTTLDLDMQLAAERALEDQLRAIENGQYGVYKHQTYQEYLDQDDENASDHAVTPYLQGAFITMEAASGYVRAMVGGRDFNDSKFNRAVQARRQAGSTFKPFVYSAAIRAGTPLSHVIDDAPLSRMIPGDTMPWEPQNFEGDFRGPTTLRRGLTLSRNLVAIGLGLEIGEKAVRGEALRYGLSTDIPEYPSMFIGAASVIPLEMVSAFTAFATLGVRAAPLGVLRVEDEAGNIVWEPQVRRDRVTDVEPAWLLTNALTDVVKYGTAHSAVWARGFTIPSGGKTGTTNDGTDVWYLGFTPELVTGVWIGLDQPQKIKARAAGGVLAAPAWTAFMKEVYERRPAPADWVRPSGLLTREVDNTTGYRFTTFCPPQTRVWEWFLPGTEPTEFCPVHSQLFGHAPGHGDRTGSN